MFKFIKKDTCNRHFRIDKREEVFDVWFGVH